MRSCLYPWSGFGIRLRGPVLKLSSSCSCTARLSPPILRAGSGLKGSRAKDLRLRGLGASGLWVWISQPRPAFSIFGIVDPPSTSPNHILAAKLPQTLHRQSQTPEALEALLESFPIRTLSATSQRCFACASERKQACVVGEHKTPTVNGNSDDSRSICNESSYKSNDEKDIVQKQNTLKINKTLYYSQNLHKAPNVFQTTKPHKRS